MTDHRGRRRRHKRHKARRYFARRYLGVWSLNQVQIAEPFGARILHGREAAVFLFGEAVVADIDARRTRA